MIAMFKLAMTQFFAMFSSLFSAGAKAASALDHGAGWCDISMETLVTLEVINREISIAEALGKAQLRANKLGLDVDVVAMLAAAKAKVVQDEALPDNILSGVGKRKAAPLKAAA